ncbi:hypothetical protein Z517_00273 [Fonsecaea pedrosoi CBS 271.37]|uniref:Uncharacterized protein n=1 Tax=Fonsecaea pedrosoi CBS 271.37 TaxID=1442368 RepID=A0A0D2H1X3_9EURO|nr:uncharacterized protein Z517_00273 [Fonsecaea pedrosoi CBS 271.37]KIW84885.1 hypothetical protein Z517_00273 [Fonsecaea pedrosoi CBS 271.37]
MNPGQLPLHLQITHLREILASNSSLMTVLARAAALNLPNWYLAGGAVSQTIWNTVSKLPPETGILDYDLVYYENSDLSYEAEDLAIQVGKRHFADVPVEVEIRNQARVHLWYEQKYGVTCQPHASVEAGIDTWISTSAMLGVRIDEAGEWIVYAPRGLSDFFNMVVRPNPVLGTREAYEKKPELATKEKSSNPVYRDKYQEMVASAVDAEYAAKPGPMDPEATPESKIRQRIAQSSQHVAT